MGEFNQPLVPAFAFGIHEDRGGRVFQYFGTGHVAGIGEALLGVVHNQFFAEGVDEVFRAAGDEELVGILRGEAHRIADDVTP